MPADWSSFISNVSDKLSSQSLKSNQETANYITDQYVSATVGKAQSPFGNTHQSGQKTIMSAALKKGMDELAKRPSPTFKQREEDPAFSDLTGGIPSGLSGGYEVINEYLKWAEENPTLAPVFKFTPLFEDPSVYPSSLDKAIPLLAQKVLSQYDGTEEFSQWVGTLPTVLGNTGKRIYDQYINIITNNRSLDIGVEVTANAVYRNENYSYGEVKALADNIIYDNITLRRIDSRGSSSLEVRGKISKITVDKLTGSTKYFVAYQKEFSSRGIITVNKEVYTDTINVLEESDSVRSRALALKSKLKYTNKVFQVSSRYDPNNIPSWVNENLIVRLNYLKSIDKGYLDQRYDFFGSAIDPRRSKSLNITDSIRSKERLYGNVQSGEVKKWFDALITWGNSLADEAKKLNDTQKGDQNDPYEIMAKGVIGYWISTLVQPLSASPPVPPCSIPTPGVYVGLFYGNQKFLADNLRRAFNTGKSFKIPGLEKTAARAVANALSISFALHLAELKFLYNGSIPTPGGPAPMVGFVPLVY
jgi:hypothetical protein